MKRLLLAILDHTFDLLPSLLLISLMAGTQAPFIVQF